MTRKHTRSGPTNRSQDWRKDMEGLTPEQPAKALPRPIGRGKANPPKSEA